jgi:XTP/dITP diphosphohydrolase
LKLLLATRNPGKIAEISSILEQVGIEAISGDDMPEDPPEVVEDGQTFEENASKKALAAARWADMPALADDSGLVVPAIGGEPGVRSSRYAGDEGNMEANMDLLLEKLADVPESERLAHFICLLVLASPDGRTWQTGGRVDGLITYERMGEGGFGYDPIFFYIPADRTFAQMGIEEKNKVSHRFRAVRAFTEKWPEIEKELMRGLGDVGKKADVEENGV